MGCRSSQMAERDRPEVASRVAASSGLVSPDLGPRRVDAEPDHVRRLCRRVVDRLGELDPLTLQVALALDGLPPPHSLEPDDDADK